MKWLLRLLRRAPLPSDNYSPRAQQLLILTRKQADRLRHGYVGTEHLLLGLLQMQEGVGFSALQMLGFDLASIRKELESKSGTGAETVIKPSIPMTPAVKKVMALGCSEASKFGHTYVGTEHLLLGLIRLRSGIAPAVLRDHGAELQKTRLVVAEILQKAASPASSSPNPLTENK